MKQGRIPGINTRKRIRGDKTIRRKIFDLCEQIVRACSPQKIILFGSYAYGQPNEDSDVDLLVIMPFKCSPHQQAFNIRMKITPPMPMDLLVRTPEHVEERIRMGDFFMQEITGQGKVLYSDSLFENEEENDSRRL